MNKFKFLLCALTTSVSPPSADELPSAHPILRDDPRQFENVPRLFQKLRSAPYPTLPVRDPAVAIGNPNKPAECYALFVSYYGPYFRGGYEPIKTVTLPTVKGYLSDRIKTILGRTVYVRTAGRTDARVSSKSNLFSFSTWKAKVHSVDDFVKKLNDLCAGSSEEKAEAGISDEAILMQVQSMTLVDNSFHATFSTNAREYIYVLPLHREDAVRGPDLATKIQFFLDSVVGERVDYHAMSKGKIRNNDSFCTLQEAVCVFYSPNKTHDNGEIPVDKQIPGFSKGWGEILAECESPTSDYSDCLVFRIRSDRFLTRMIRKMINALLQETDVETPTEDQWKQRLSTRYRGKNQPVPGEGLCFWRAFVPLTRRRKRAALAQQRRTGDSHI